MFTLYICNSLNLETLQYVYYFYEDKKTLSHAISVDWFTNLNTFILKQTYASTLHTITLYICPKSYWPSLCHGINSYVHL